MILLEDGDYLNEKTVCALGLFDGVHTGHRLIINKAVSLAEEKGMKSAVFCFKTNTVTSKSKQGELLSDEEKLKEFEKLKVDYVYSPDFSLFREMSPEDFVTQVLCKKLKCACAVCGTDFTFGKFAEGRAEDLEKYGQAFEMKSMIMEKICDDGEEVSSTSIRNHIKSGEISRANKLLGYRFGYSLEVVHGFEVGRKWGFPTINQKIPEGRIVPAYGVYCSTVEFDGKKYHGVTNIGVKPTVEKDIKEPLAETYIIDFDGDLYGKTVRTELYEFIRREKKFDDFGQLKNEIIRNTEYTRKYFELNGNV